MAVHNAYLSKGKDCDDVVLIIYRGVVYRYGRICVLNFSARLIADALKNTSENKKHLFTIPSGFTPSFEFDVMVNSLSGKCVHVTIKTDGSVIFDDAGQGITGSPTVLGNISFVAQEIE